MIAPLPGAWPERPGSATLPFFGVVPILVDDKARGCLPRVLIGCNCCTALVGWTWLPEYAVVNPIAHSPKVHCSA